MPGAAQQSDSVQGPVHRKDRLIQEKRLVEVNSCFIREVFTKSVCHKHTDFFFYITGVRCTPLNVQSTFFQEKEKL